MITTSWIIADGTYALDATFYCGKNKWSKFRDNAKIYEDKAEAEKIAFKLDSKVWEVQIGSELFCQPFRVVEWGHGRLQ